MPTIKKNNLRLSGDFHKFPATSDYQKFSQSQRLSRRRT